MLLQYCKYLNRHENNFKKISTNTITKIYLDSNIYIYFFSCDYSTYNRKYLSQIQDWKESSAVKGMQTHAWELEQGMIKMLFRYLSFRTLLQVLQHTEPSPFWFVVTWSYMYIWFGWSHIYTIIWQEITFVWNKKKISQILTTATKCI